MKITYRLSNGVTITGEGDNLKNAFRDLAQAIDLFRHAQFCEKCKELSVYPQVRDKDGTEFFGFRCAKCDAELNIGQRKDGWLYIRRKDEQGQPLPDHGWKVWKKAAS